MKNPVRLEVQASRWLQRQRPPGTKSAGKTAKKSMAGPAGLGYNGEVATENHYQIEVGF